MIIIKRYIYKLIYKGVENMINIKEEINSNLEIIHLLETEEGKEFYNKYHTSKLNAKYYYQHLNLLSKYFFP